MENPPMTYKVILLTNRQTDRQTDKQRWKQYPHQIMAEAFTVHVH